ncbi:thioredoxin-like protein, partial [Catenaria anguillulae PL171]
VKVDVVSDGVCPFCFLGKRKLDLAVQQFHSKYPNDPAPLNLDVTWHPFQLDSTMPVGKSFPTKMWFAQRFGPHWDGYKHVMKVGAQVGVKFDFDGEIGSTFDYHRLLRHVVSEHGSHVQNKLAELLFTEHFENGRSLAEHKTLLDAAVAVGLDRAKLEVFLVSDAESEAVRSEVSRAKASGIRGVPDFSVEGGRWAVHGAEEPATWLRIFEKI